MEEKTTAQGEGPWAGDEEAQDQGNYSGQKWINVNKSNPCFHCGGTDRCSILYDGSWCNCRNPSANDTEPTGGEIGVDAYWAHPYNADGPSDRGSVPPGPPCASLRDRHKVYEALLALLSLSGAHGKALRARGFTDGQIKKRGYRTMPGKDRVTVAEKLVAQFGEDLIRKVPGFYWRPAEKDWSMAGMAGILVPALTIDGSINALRIRLDKPDASGKRYHWLSSSTHGGPGVIACVHVPCPGPNDVRTVRITEGELKADLATDLSGVTTLSVPGVRCWEKALTLLPRLASGTLHRVKTIRVAFDADAEHKLDVAHALKQLITDKRTQKYAVEMEVWDEIQPDGRETKGIDDLLAAGLPPTVLTGEAVLEEVERIMAAAEAAREKKDAGEDAGAGAGAGAEGQHQQSRRPNYYTAADLQHKEIPLQKWAIPEYVPEGLTVFAGAHKMFKSWFALAVGIAVASGGKVFGEIEVQQGDVLYYALEDTERRMQDRMRKILAGEPWPSRLTLAHSLPRLHEGGLPEITTWLEEHPEARLIIIDTLAKVKPPNKSNGNAYEEDYRAMSAVKVLADKCGVGILAITHTRKAVAEDPFDMVSGSMGLVAPADATMVLMRKRGQHEATLHITGRDLEERANDSALLLRWNPQTWCWVLAGTVEQQMSEGRQVIIDVMKRAKEPLTPSEVSKRSGKNPNTVKNLMKKMWEAGEIHKAGGGKYEYIDLKTAEWKNP